MAEPNVKDSILNSIKKLLGINPADTSFDDEITIHINSVIASLIQMGIGPQDGGYTISDSSSLWSDFLGTDKRLESVKSYIYMKVKLIFDTPQQGAIIEAYQNQIKEFEYRNYITKDNDRIDAEAALAVDSSSEY